MTIEITNHLQPTTFRTGLEATFYAGDERLPMRFRADGRSGDIEWSSGGFNGGCDIDFARTIEAGWREAVAQADRILAIMREHEDKDARIAALLELAS